MEVLCPEDAIRFMRRVGIVRKRGGAAQGSGRQQVHDRHEAAAAPNRQLLA